VAIIGAGPAGIYAAESLAAGEVSVDVLDRLPCPFGLVRYGVAPDHPKLKSISSSLQKILEGPGVRFLGNVDAGVDVSVAELHRFYDALIFTHGAAIARRMDIPGEDLPGSFSATDFVSWYGGHPDATIDHFALEARSVAVIGVGNVAIDVTRLLAKAADDLRPTDICDHALHVLERSAVEDIHLIGRRGPVQATFTTKELRELGELPNVDMIVDPAELELDEASRLVAAQDPGARRNLEILQEWSQRPPAGRPRRVHVRFLLRPVEVLGDGEVAGIRLERTRLDDNGRVVGTGQLQTVEAQMVLRSVGYRGVPFPGLPFDEDKGVIPNQSGRVLDGSEVVRGEYVAGWIKRGPVGLIGSNRRDAKETVAALLEDVPALPPAPERDDDGLPALLAERGVDVVTWEGWRAIERLELEIGAAQGRERVKVADRERLLRVASEAVRSG
jgi:ferredoxin--NADP+ reductase